jgi:hypothetical protein
MSIDTDDLALRLTQRAHGRYSLDEATKCIEALAARGCSFIPGRYDCEGKAHAVRYLRENVPANPRVSLDVMTCLEICGYRVRDAA